jgi:hypothetical protein
VTPETATFSKAAAADVVITVSGNATVTGLKNASATVNTDNYTISGSTLTIKSTYLAALANGDKTFHVLATADGAEQDLVVTVTVGD